MPSPFLQFVAEQKALTQRARVHIIKDDVIRQPRMDKLVETLRLHPNLTGNELEKIMGHSSIHSLLNRAFKQGYVSRDNRVPHRYKVREE